MDSLEALQLFRRDLYSCFTRWGDALFELCDAVLESPAPVSSIPTLSLEPVFRRSHGSLYKALDRANIDTKALRDLLITNRPSDWPDVFAVDASTWARCDAETSPERGFHYSASKHSAGQPIVAGWSYQWISQLDWAPDSWTAPLDAQRIPPSANATDFTIHQIRCLCDRLAIPSTSTPPMFVFDAGYDPIALSDGLSNTRTQVLCRISPRRVFHTKPGRRRGPTKGRPPRHGPRFALSEPDTWTEPDHQLHTHHPRYGNITVTAWDGLHPKLHQRGRWADHPQPPIISGTIIRVQVEHLPKPCSGRNRKELWLWHTGPEPCDLNLCWRAYLRRFDIEHTFRFIKNTLGWTTPAIRTPQQGDTWTSLTVAAYTQLRLARAQTNDNRLPWERPLPDGKLTPTRVRRAFRRLRPTLNTPAQPPKTTSPGPGRPKGTRKPPRTRHPAIKKTTPQAA